MAIYYADDVSGNDSDDGTTEALAKKTIAAGIALLAASDTLYIKSATYTITSTLTLTGAVGGPAAAPTLIKGYGTTPGDRLFTGVSGGRGNNEGA